MDDSPQQIFSRFDAEGRFLSATPFGNGHINDTFLVNTSARRYILQRMNQSVFRHPEQVIQNLQGVTNHLRWKIQLRGGNPDRETLTLIPTKQGKGFYRAEDGEYYRVFLFIEGASTFEVVENPEHFYRAARALGRFQKDLADFPARQLYDTIPNFHNTPLRYQALLEAIERDSAGRLGLVEAEIAFVKERTQYLNVITSRLADGRLPLRVTHNDTKFNNIMIDDETGEGICVIDLDTVMPGSLLYDFGDSIRSGATMAEEDEPDLSKVSLSLPLFEQFTRGFLEEVTTITPEERELLPLSAIIMTLECGIRFLADYLDGDVYFKVARPQHNLDRTRTQFKLVRDMELHLDELKQIVANCSNL